MARGAEDLAMANAIYNGIRLAHDQLKREVLSCVLQIRSTRFSSTITKYYVFPKVVRLATSLVCSMTRDLHGIPLMKLAGRARPHPHASLTILPLGGDTHVLFSYHRSYRDYFKRFFDQFDGGTDEERQVWLTKLLLCAYENVVFSPSFIESLDPRDRQLMEAWMMHQYEMPLPMPYVPNFNYFE